MLFFANSAYENYVGMDIVTIGEKLNISERSVINAINELEKIKSSSGLSILMIKGETIIF